MSEKVKAVEWQPPIKKHLFRKAAQNNIPISGNFELTPRCNLNCKMCYIHMNEAEIEASGAKEQSAEWWLELGRQAVSEGMLFVLLTGGEPFARKDFFEIYEGLRKMGLLITINSNGTMLSPQVIERLSHNAPTKIHVTLYGGSNETYERLCGLKNGFDIVTKNILAVKGSGIPIDLNASFTSYNVDDMELIYNFAKENDLQVNGTSYMFPPMRNGHTTDDEVRLNAKEAGEARARLIMCNRSEEEIESIRNLIRKDEDISDKVDHECHMQCMAGRGSFWATWDGRMLPCGMLNLPEISIVENGFKKSWEYTIAQTENIYLPKECVNCSKKQHCILCAALSAAEGDGDSTKKPEYLCQMTETYIKEMCR